MPRRSRAKRKRHALLHDQSDHGATAATTPPRHLGAMPPKHWPAACTIAMPLPNTEGHTNEERVMYVSVSAVRAVVDELQRQGTPASALCEHAGVTPAELGEATLRLPIDRYNRIVRTARALSTT